jgi:hypothetical protein
MLLALALLGACTASHAMQSDGAHGSVVKPSGKTPVSAALSTGKSRTGTEHTPQPMLPAAFAGHPRDGAVQMSGSPATVDAAHAAVLAEDGLREAASARYRGIGEAAYTVQVFHFGDATGAFSAFTFYRQPSMHAESVGSNAAADASTFLAQDNASLVIVRSVGVEAGSMDGDALRLRPAVRALLQTLPHLQGPEAVAPALPGLIPGSGLNLETVHYAIGPASYNGPLPIAVLDFNRDAEVATAHYTLGSGSGATLTLIMSPTPEIAHAQENAIKQLPDVPLHAGVRRVGPLVGVVSGVGISAADAQSLLLKLHYTAEVTLDVEPGPTQHSEIVKTARLLLGIAYLTGLLAIAAVVIAIFLGAGRVLIRRLRGKPDSSMNDDDFIALHL